MSSTPGPLSESLYDCPAYKTMEGMFSNRLKPRSKLGIGFPDKFHIIYLIQSSKGPVQVIIRGPVLDKGPVCEVKTVYQEQCGLEKEIKEYYTRAGLQLKVEKSKKK